MAFWGEFGPSLEDVAALTSVPLVDEVHAIGMALNAEDQKRLDVMYNSLSNSKYG